MASKLEETFAHRKMIRDEYETKMRETLERIAVCNLPTSRRVLVAQFSCWLEANERCNEAARELSESVVVELSPRETFRAKAVAV